MQTKIVFEEKGRLFSLSDPQWSLLVGRSWNGIVKFQPEDTQYWKGHPIVQEIPSGIIACNHPYCKGDCGFPALIFPGRSDLRIGGQSPSWGRVFGPFLDFTGERLEASGLNISHGPEAIRWWWH
jgi:hypothetical protein